MERWEEKLAEEEIKVEGKFEEDMRKAMKKYENE